MNILILVLLLFLIVGLFPGMPYYGAGGAPWGYYGSGGVGLVLLIIVILALAGRL